MNHSVYYPAMVQRTSALRVVPAEAVSRRRGRPAISPTDRAARLDEILAAATRVFRSRGYGRAQMADVARAMGASAGNLYNYVESKEALFHLLVERGFNPDRPIDVPRLPVPTPPPGATLDLLRRRLAEESRLPVLEAALKRRRVGDVRVELEEVLRELYRTMASGREGIALLERSAVEWPELAAIFYQDMRRGVLARIEAYLRARIRAGHFRRVPDVAAAARFVNETIAWMAMHRHGDVDSRNVTDEAAESTTIDALVHAFVEKE
jgi:AcrR family transcriptional regulator